MHGNLFWWGVILSPWTWAFVVLFVVLLIVVFVTAFVRRRRLLAASEALQAPAPTENLVRFCPGCGSVGTVSAEFRDCCPDGGHARAIPESLAHRCHDLFGLALGNASESIDPGVVVSWAVDRWLAEVKNRPLVNVHRRSLDDTWRQVMRRFGGDPDALVGPSHDELLASKGDAK